MCDLLLYLFCYQVFDSWLDIDLKGYEQFVGLKQQHPDKKFLIALGGWTDSRYLLINNSPTPNWLSILSFYFISILIQISDYLNLSVFLSKYLSIYPNIYPNIYPSIQISIHLSKYLSIYPNKYLSIYQNKYLSIYPNICPSIQYLSIYKNLSIYQKTFPSIKTSNIQISIHLLNYLSTHWTSYISTQLSKIYSPVHKLPNYISMYILNHKYFRTNKYSNLLKDSSKRANFVSEAVKFIQGCYSIII